MPQLSSLLRYSGGNNGSMRQLWKGYTYLFHRLFILLLFVAPYILHTYFYLSDVLFCYLCFIIYLLYTTTYWQLLLLTVKKKEFGLSYRQKLACWPIPVFHFKANIISADTYDVLIFTCIPSLHFSLYHVVCSCTAVVTFKLFTWKKYSIFLSWFRARCRSAELVF